MRNVVDIWQGTGDENVPLSRQWESRGKVVGGMYIVIAIVTHTLDGPS